MSPFSKVALLVIVSVSSACKVRASATANIDAGGGLEEAGDVDVEGEGVTSVTLRREGDEIVHEGGEINFDTNKATLVGEKTEATLKTYADLLEQYPKVELRIEGHTDSRGSENHNRQLSDERAHAVREWLISQGIEESRLTAVGFGEDNPKDPEPPECKDQRAADAEEWCEDRIWSRNRRSEFHVTAGANSLPDSDFSQVPSKAAKPRYGFHTSPYLYLSPGLFRVPVATRDETDSRRISYRWGLGAGYLWRRNRFAAGMGLGFAHVPVSVDEASDRCSMVSCLSSHEFVLDAELRLGGGSPRVIGYGLLGPGLVLGRSKRTDGVTEVTFRTGGFNLDVGAGIWGLAWKGLFLGSEVALNLGLYTDDAGAFHDTAKVAGLDVRFLLGWHFGWKGQREGK